MSQWVCLRCDWTGEGGQAACPNCGSPLYRIAGPEPTKPPSPIELPRDDESGPPWVPAAPVRNRGASIILSLMVAAAGTAFGFIRLNTPEPREALGGVVVKQEKPAASETSASDGSPSTSSPASPTEPDTCSDRPAATAAFEPPGASEVPSAAVTADYRFQNSLRSSLGTAPDLVEIGRGLSGFANEIVLGQTRAVLTFDRGRGLSLASTTGVIDDGEFTIELLFRLCRLDGYRKIIDFHDASDDRGLYSLDGSLNFYPRPPAARATIAVDAYVQVVLTRDASEMVVGYVDGVRQFSFRDRRELAVVDANDTLLFFRDDSTTGTEYSGGAVSRIRLYDRPLTGNQVAWLVCTELPGAICG